MLGLSLLLTNATLNLSVDLPTALSATLNLSDATITQQLLFAGPAATYVPYTSTLSPSLGGDGDDGDATTDATTMLPAIVLNGPLQHAPQFTAETALRVTVLTCMAVASLIGNVATMWNIRHQEGYVTSGGGGGGSSNNGMFDRRLRRRRRRRTARHHSWSAVYFLIFHLAVADLLVTAFCIGGEAAWSYAVAWQAGRWACKGLKFAQMFSLYLSTFVMVLVGVDRWVAVKYPWKSLHMQRRCYRLVGLAWLAAGVLSVPQVFIFDVVQGPFVEEFHQCVTYGFYTAFWQEQVYTTFTLMCMFVVPLAVLVGTYVATFRTIAASERMFQQTDVRAQPPATTTMPSSQLPSQGTSPAAAANDFNGMDQSQSHKRQQLIHRAKIKSLRISVVIVSAFIVCWSPYYVMMMSFVFLHPDSDSVGSDAADHSADLQSAIFCFGMSNSVVNPIVYGLFHLWPMRQRRRTEDRMQAASGGRGGEGGTTTTLPHGGTRSSFTKESQSSQRTTALINTNSRATEDHRLLPPSNNAKTTAHTTRKDATEPIRIPMDAVPSRTGVLTV